MERPPLTPDEQEADTALRDARSRFVAGFTQRHEGMRLLLAGAPGDDPSGPYPALRAAAHKMAGLAGVLGFPTVSTEAAALERLLEAPGNVDAARGALARMGAAFTHDLAGAPPSWAMDHAPVAAGARILIVEDDEDQRRVTSSGLRASGYRVLIAGDGAEGIQIALAEHPDLIVLDVDMPELDGMAVCRQVKLHPVLSAVPIVFCTARAGVMDRMAGLALGADDYVTKPFAPAELLLRIRRLLGRPAAVAAPAGDAPALPYDRFTAAAAEVLAAGPAALVMLRVARLDVESISVRLATELRRRDVLGRFSDSHLVVLSPGLSAAAAKAAVVHAIEEVRPRLGPVEAGAADGGHPLDQLIAAADLALAQDRVTKSGGGVGKATILLAEDDPDVLHIIDSRLRAAGYRTVLSLDGEQTLAAIDREGPEVVLLDLMMPKLTGFDVLTRLRERRDARPRTIVVSARGRESDVTRAFDLGADDYVTKPFNPDELVARIARLTR
jgi:two-component system, cell cycle response regulator